MTTDGAANERLGASQLVGDGNDHHCDAHHIQLCIEDNLGKESTVANCAPHRAVLRKAHQLVILITGHKDISTEFARLAYLKRTNAENGRMFEALIINNETRWDSELAMLERLVVFDPEIMQLYNNAQLGIDPECILTRFEFDLAFGMTLVLGPLRFFTKFVQQREAVTLAHVPRLIDELVTKLAPQSFDHLLIGRADGVIAALNSFQTALVVSIKARYAPMFNSPSLARSAAFFLPGMVYRDFANFPNPDENGIVQRVIDRIVLDAENLLPPGVDRRERIARRARSALVELREDLDELDPNDPENDPLKWIPIKSNAPVLFPVSKLYLAIFSTSAEDERNFSSAGFTLDKLRSRLDIENFRYEHRIRRFLTAGSDAQTQVGRALRKERAERLLQRFSERFGVVPAADVDRR